MVVCCGFRSWLAARALPCGLRLGVRHSTCRDGPVFNLPLSGGCVPVNGLAKRSARRRGALVTTATPARAMSGVVETSGERVTQRVAAQRAGWLADLVTSMAATQLATVWSAEQFDRFTAGDGGGFAYKTVGAVFGLPAAPDNIHVSSRVRRAAGAVVGETLRAAIHRRTIVDGLREEHAGVLEWAQVCGTFVEKRNTKRHISAHERRTGTYPGTFFVLTPQPPTFTATVVKLANSGDNQIAQWLAPDDGKLRLRVLLPTTEHPTRRDWEWHVLAVSVDPTVLVRVLAGTALLTLPSLRCKGRKLLVDITVDTPAGAANGSPDRVFAMDWGVGRLLTGALVVREADGTLSTDGRMFVFDASAWHKKDHDRRCQAQLLRRKADRLEVLDAGRTASDPATVSRVNALRLEARTVDAARRQANVELARLGALWAVSQAHALGAGVVALEDLGSMEPKFHKSLRINLSQRIRGALAAAFTTCAAANSIRFVPVDPAHTSAACPYCTGKVRHVVSPDRLTAGYHWAVCSGCGVGRDRDLNAAVNIGARALRTPASGARVKKSGHVAGSPHHDLGNVTRMPGPVPASAPTPRTSTVHNPQHPDRRRKSAAVPTPGKAGPTRRRAEALATARERSRVHRGSTPPRPGHRPKVAVLSGYRAAGLGTTQVRENSSPTRQPEVTSFTVPHVNPPPLVWVRLLDGVAYGHRHRLRFTPVRILPQAAADR